MSEELLKKLLDEASKLGIRRVGIAGNGEPLLHPKFSHFLNEISNRGMTINLATNGTLLRGKMAEKVLTSNVDSVELSFDGNTPEQYAQGKGVNQFAVAKKHILRFLEMAKESRKDIAFNIHFVDIGHLPLREKLKYIRFWRRQLAGLRFGTNFIYRENNKAGVNDRKNSGFGDAFSVRRQCNQLKGLNVTWNGDVYYCGNNFCDTARLGNVSQGTLKSFFEGETRQRVVASQINGDFSHGGCNECSETRGFPVTMAANRAMYYLSLLP